MKTDSRKCINIRKIVEYLGTVIAFMELHGMTQILLYMLLGKLKFLKCLNEKKAQAFKDNCCFMQSLRSCS